MRQMRIVLFIACVLCVMELAAAAARLDLEVHVGYDGYYREKTVTPVAVQVKNGGDTVRGEFRVFSKQEGAIPDRYRFPVYLPKGAKKLFFFYIIPERFTNEIVVELWSDGKEVATEVARRCKPLYPTDRLVVVVGGTGSSLSYVNGQPITVPDYPLPGAWDFAGQMNYQEQLSYARHSGSTSPTGNVRLVYVDAALLPDNPEAYGSIALLALMSDVTENTLKAMAQEAIPLWVANGGHVLIAGGGARNRLEAPFFRGLLPGASSSAIQPEKLATADGDTALTAPLGAGRVTALHFDPDMVQPRDWQKISRFYGKLAARNPRISLGAQLREKLGESVMVRNLRPPDFKLIVGFLVLYLVMLVPVNYFVLKKMDKRELAWVTTPAIVLVFTVGAYGIGYLTKGHRLIVNVVSMVETVAGQTAAEAVSETLIFSPSRTNYRMRLGEGALLVRELGMQREDPYGGYNPQERRTTPLTITAAETLTVDNVRVDMWDFRQFVTAHRLSLGNGFSAKVHAGAPGSTPRATGTITNGTPYNFALCELYADGALAATFALPPGNTVTVEKAAGVAKPALSEDELHMLNTLRPAVTQQFSGGNPFSRGLILVGYTSAAQVPVELNGRKPSAGVTVMVVHL